MNDDIVRVDFTRTYDEIAFRIRLLSDQELNTNLKEHKDVMKLFCKKVMPKLFGEGKYTMTSIDDTYNVNIKIICDTKHPGKLADSENVVSLAMNCPEGMDNEKQRLLFALVCVFKSMFTKESDSNDHQMPFNGTWTYDSTQVETVYKQPKIPGFSGCSVMTQSIITQVLHCPDFKSLDDVKKHLEGPAKEKKPVKSKATKAKSSSSKAKSKQSSSTKKPVKKPVKKQTKPSAKKPAKKSNTTKKKAA